MSQAITSKRGQVDGLRWPPELPKGFLPSNASSGYRPARTVAVRGDGEFDSITWLEGSERRTSTGVATFLHGIHPEIRLNRRARRSARAAKLTRSAEPAMPPRVAAAPHRAKRRPPRNWLRPGQQQPEFSALPSKLTFGPPTDISMGWDGTLWAIDQSGAAHPYDPTEQQWQLQGQGISAAAVVPDNSEYHATLYLFRGSEFVTVAPGGTYQTSTPKTIAEQWPHLPDTFKMGVVGATWGGVCRPW